MLATLFCDVLRIRREVTEENLLHAFPEMSDAQRRRLTWRMWEHLFLFAVEVIHSSRKLHPTNCHHYVRFKGEAEAVRALLDERPLVHLTAHFGSFELGSFITALLGYEIYSVARPLDNPYLDRFINGFRGSRGQTILSKKSDYERIRDLLAGGATVMFVADQYAGSKGCWVEFFNRPASAHKAIALLALNHDALIGVGHCRRLGRPMHFELTFTAVIDPRTVKDEIDGVRQLTQWYTREFEKMIRQTPEQYWWLHRRWKDNRPARRRRQKESKAA